ARRPFEVCRRKVDARRRTRAAGGRVDARGRRVAEEVQEPRAARDLADARAQRAVVEEEAGVEVVEQIHFERQAAFVDDEELASLGHAAVLRAALGLV